MTNSYQPHLELIRAALRQIEDYIPDNQDDFIANQMAQDAILMRLQEIGENLSRMQRIDKAFFAEHAPESWFQVIGLRHIISHGYHLIDAEQIWQIVTEELIGFGETINAFEGGI